MMTDEEARRGWIHGRIERISGLARGNGLVHLTISGAWDVDIPLDVAVRVDARPGTMVSFEVADTHAPGGENTLYQVAIGEVVIWTA